MTQPSPPSPIQPQLPPQGCWASRWYVAWVALTFSVLVALVLTCSQLPKDYHAYQYSLFCFDVLKGWLTERLTKKPNPPSIVAFGSSHLGWGLRINEFAHNLGYADNSAINAAMPSLNPKAYPAIIDLFGPRLVKSRVWLIEVADYWISNPTYNGPGRLKDQFIDRIPFFLLLNDIGGTQRLTWFEHLRILPKPLMTGLYMDPGGEWVSQKDPRMNVYASLTPVQVINKVQDYYDNLVYSADAFQPVTELVNIAKQHHIKVVVMIMPRCRRWNVIADHMVPEFRHQAQPAINRWIQQHHLDVVDCQGKDAPCGLTDRDFNDPVHLNRLGAKHFTQYLSKRLKAYAK